MAFLSQAIGQVLNRIKSTHQLDREREATRRAQEQAAHEVAQREAQEEADFQRRLLAFQKAFPTPSAQAALMDRYRTKFPHLPHQGQAVKSLVISAWWSDFKGSGLPTGGTVANFG